MSREIKYRVWDNENKSYNDPYSYAYYAMTQDGGLDFYCHGDRMDEADPDVYFIEQYTGLKDKNGDKEIYEYDIIDGEGNIIGNYHETPELLKDRTNLLIQGFGTKTWLTTYQEAVERGCHDA